MAVTIAQGPLTKRSYKIYATSEERKQRNRQAQAAFRERRTEYIKQLEATIKQHEDTLQALQANHRTAADECLMLRYKNSLLERILLEKGIDVNAELRAKTGSPNMGAARMPPPATAPAHSPMQRAMMNRQQARRSLVGMPPKVEGVQGAPFAHPEGLLSSRSPHSQPTPTSSGSSPSTAATQSPNFVPQGVSPNIGPVGQQPHLRPQQPRTQLAPLQRGPPQRPSVVTSHASSSSTVSSAVGGEQEYDAAADMYDDQDASEHSAGPGPYPQTFPPQMPAQGIQPPTQNIAQQIHAAAGGRPADHANFGGVPQMFDAYDSMLDADPFGLTASMHFPTQFSYETR
ncbi:hypothetical protein H2201_001708 [Coniosporium apollinis]|uniref:BZIP domain-containing protein n=1 Tax=Coniosporium apollinis TaxID=61459 RepID=A0ABQ9P205_9PEZI|nr:hypothetical protein H2201_001708 [Coniosporium apollinis]